MIHDIRGYWDSTFISIGGEIFNRSLDPSQIVKRQSAGILDIILLNARLLVAIFLLTLQIYFIASSHIMRFSSTLVLAIVAGLATSSSATPVEGSATDRCAEFCFGDGACAACMTGLVYMLSESCFCFPISAV
ncbi:uncharacterized protein F5147DRAFT_762436 [Suillus discolor]|uniref:Uncharacterized protein n=1 Tax=Suillus discolor TaxID=1912936 RepID=A0A9P7F1X0_9AGAM|nr:uncharacterized protein F5147DRAFT_762436 [Suillus discolor]KAG2102830.1 hypothetical protein F5147DRAFT_762436 [Suillus discolor]